MPKLFLGACLVFWGWSTLHLEIALFLAFSLELSNLLKYKWDLSKEDFVKISDLNSLVLVGYTIIIYIDSELKEFVLNLVKWIPIAFIPILFAQVYSISEKIIIGTVLGTKKNKKAFIHKPIDIRYPYALLCIIAAAMGNKKDISYYTVLFLIFFWASLYIRNKRYSLKLFVSLMLSAAFMGFAMINLMSSTDLYLREKAKEYFKNWYLRQNTDPFKSTTMLGEIGLLKLSDTIIMRIIPNTHFPNFLYITEATYDTFLSTIWYNKEMEFRTVKAIGINTWELYDPPQTSQSLSFIYNYPKNEGVLPTYSGTFKIENLEVVGLQKNEYGTLKFLESPNFIQYKVVYDSNSDYYVSPSKADLHIPKNELPAIQKIAQELELEQSSQSEVVETIRNYFKSNFSYTTKLTKPKANTTALEHFLLHKKAGHCEYFATATVLLLRQAGIPARYVTGFGVDEYSSLEEAYIVREKDKHAWASAYLDGKWTVIDNTPSVWLKEDEQNQSFFKSLSDFFAFFRLKLFLIQKQKNFHIQIYLILGVIILSIFLFFRIFSKRLLKEKATIFRQSGKKNYDPILFDFEHVEIHLNKLLGKKRKHNETYLQWLQRIGISDQSLYELLKVHYKIRFSTEEITKEEKEKFSKGVIKWIVRPPNKL